MRAILLVFFLLAFITTAIATDPSLTDDILILYRLSPAQEAQFSDHDSIASPFWAVWDQENAQMLARDYLAMASDNVVYAWNRCVSSPFSGLDDAQMIVRGAYSDKGAYFYFDVVDDKFVEPAGWPSDVVDILIDSLPAVQFMSPQMICENFECQWIYILHTLSTKQIQLSMGSTQAVASFNYRFYDYQAMSFMDHIASFGDSAYDFATMEIIKQNSLRKIQEWFLPWSQTGISKTITGSQYAFSCGYNDIDSIAMSCVNSLRWQGLCDPYCEPPSENAVWGGIELGPCLDTNGCSNAARNPIYQKSNILKENSQQHNLFTLKGERVSPSIKHLNNRILIRHKIGKDGKRNSLIDPVKAK